MNIADLIFHLHIKNTEITYRQGLFAHQVFLNILHKKWIKGFNTEGNVIKK